jgi:hypothetical protein
MFFFLVQSLFAAESSGNSLNLSATWKALIPALCMIGLILFGVSGYFIWGRNFDEMEAPQDEEEENLGESSGGAYSQTIAEL